MDHGVYVIGDSQAQTPGVVPNSPADKAGIKEGDVIVSVNGEELTDSFTLSNSIADYQVNDVITLGVWRDGETLSIQLTLEERTE